MQILGDVLVKVLRELGKFTFNRQMFFSKVPFRGCFDISKLMGDIEKDMPYDLKVAIVVTELEELSPKERHCRLMDQPEAAKIYIDTLLKHRRTGRYNADAAFLGKKVRT